MDDEAGISPDELELFIESPAWKSISERIGKMYQAEARNLANASSWDTARHCQGFMAGVEACVRIPQILLNEAKGKKPA